jgi:hypothetical protein
VLLCRKIYLSTIQADFSGTATEQSGCMSAGSLVFAFAYGGGEGGRGTVWEGWASADFRGQRLGRTIDLRGLPGRIHRRLSFDEALRELRLTGAKVEVVEEPIKGLKLRHDRWSA